MWTIPLDPPVSDPGIHSQLPKLEGSISQEVIKREEITVPYLYTTAVDVVRDCDGEFHSPVEGASSVLGTVVSIGFFGVHFVDPGFDINVTSSLVIFAFNIFCRPDDQTSFELSWWSWGYTPNLLFLHLLLRYNIYPTSNRSLF